MLSTSTSSSLNKRVRLSSTSSNLDEKVTVDVAKDNNNNNNKDEYVPPKVWAPAPDMGGKFGGINRPTAGARELRDLPVGKHPLQLYSLGTPNGQKITILLEELLEAGHSGAEYDAHYIDIMKGDQFTSGFVALNPNSKIPALLDTKTNTRMFESGSMLLQLAEQFDHAFLPAGVRPEILHWLFWQMGSAPYLGGGFGHFYSYAPYKMQYPIDRFSMEVKRQMDVLEQQLAQPNHTYLTGEEYTLADIAIYPWYGLLALGKLYEGSRVFLNVDEDYPHVVKWAERIQARPAVRRGSIVNKTWGDVFLKERHDASDFDGIFDDETETQAKL